MPKKEKKEKPPKQYKKRAEGSFTKQRALTWASYAAIIVLSVISSCYQLFFDLEHFDSTKFITKLAISVTIAIFAMLLSIRDGETTNETRKSGDYYDIKQAFAAKLKLLINKEWFKQWCDEILYVRERKAYVMELLNQYNIFDYEYVLVQEDDLKRLLDNPARCRIGIDADGKPVEKALDQIDEFQLKGIRKIKKGIDFPKLEYTYFTSRNSRNGYKYQATLQETQRRRKIWALAYRIMVIAITTSIFALAIVNPFDSSTEQVIYDTISRVTTLLTTCFMGYTIANDEMLENMDSLEFKGDKIDEYLTERESGSFVPVSRDERIKARIEELERKRKEEAEAAVNSIVDPIVEPPEEPPKPVGTAIAPVEGEVVIEMTQEEYEARFGKK